MARAGNEITVQPLLAHDTIDINLANANDETPLTIAARERHVNVVRQFLEYCFEAANGQQVLVSFTKYSYVSKFAKLIFSMQ